MCPFYCARTPLPHVAFAFGNLHTTSPHTPHTPHTLAHSPHLHTHTHYTPRYTPHPPSSMGRSGSQNVKTDGRQNMDGCTCAGAPTFRLLCKQRHLHLRTCTFISSMTNLQASSAGHSPPHYTGGTACHTSPRRHSLPYTFSTTLPNLTCYVTATARSSRYTGSPALLTRRSSRRITPVAIYFLRALAYARDALAFASRHLRIRVMRHSRRLTRRSRGAPAAHVCRIALQPVLLPCRLCRNILHRCRCVLLCLPSYT